MYVRCTVSKSTAGEHQMTRSQIMTAAHEVARRDSKRFGISYREALADGIRAVHATIAYEARMMATHGFLPGFSMPEPKRVWA